MGPGCGRWEIHADLEEALGCIFGSFREGFGPLKLLFFLPPFPHGTVGVGIKKGRQKEKRWAAGRKS